MSSSPRRGAPAPERTTVTATYSEIESDRAVLPFRGPEGEAATVIITRRNS